LGRYDYKTLSPQDFEELTRDLLQAEWKVRLEAFKSGRDQGIDLRYAPHNGGKTIVQCKHYASSSFSLLLSHLRDSELLKVQRLSPQRYVVVTSLPLSTQDKDKIFDVFKPYILTTGDILGADDLSGLLVRHSEVEKANFKLWLTSTAVLDRVLHNAEVCQTEFEIERIREKLSVFVQSAAFLRAKQLLDDQRVLIISGVPGIGKTTLAEMLMFAHLEDGFQPIVLQSNVAEGKKLFHKQNKQIFYYDDFLGQTFLGDQRAYVGGNQDAAIVNFMGMVRSTPHSKFILTTREHILQQAFQISERFLHSTLMLHRCILELRDYSFAHRARILYNHLYFSSLPQEHRDVILQDDFFLDIIKHQHFNPRIIEWLSSLTRLGFPGANQYKQSINQLLDSPERLWSHAFETQISDEGRSLLLTLYSLGESTSIMDLETAFEPIHRGSAERYNRSRSAADFRDALQELDGAFLVYRSGRASFINPSIRDFVAGVLCRTPAIALDLLSDSVRFKQVRNIWQLANDRSDQPLLATLTKDENALCRLIERVLYGESTRWQKEKGGLFGYPIDVSEEARLEWLVTVCEAMRESSLIQLTEKYATFLISHWQNNTVDFRATVTSLAEMKEATWYLSNGGQAVYRAVQDGLLSHLKIAGANDWLALLELPKAALEWLATDESRLSEALDYYRREGIQQDRDNCSGSDDLNELRLSLSDLSDRFGLDVADWLNWIDEEIAEQTLREPEYQGGSYSGTSSVAHSEKMTEDDVRNMFETLKN
jgi:hypothetical protein